MKSKKFLFTLFIILGAFLIVYLTENISDYEKEKSLASCLTEKGAVFYGSDSCGYCVKQKNLFEEDFLKINYVNCVINRDKCNQEGITAYPTWIINGNKYIGLQSLDKLSNLSGCEK